MGLQIPTTAFRIILQKNEFIYGRTGVSDKFGNLAAEYSYDAWGRMRNVTNWQVYATGTEPELRFGRGYTGHEHLNKFGLINMNARLYDPVLGRFLAPDPLVASPDESNGYNRYMYASNNPLMYVDINGEQHIDNNGVWFNPNGKGNNTGSNFGGNPNTNLTGSDYTGGFNMGGGFNYNGGYGSGYGGGFGGGYSYGVSGNPIAFMFFLGDLFYTSKSERERFNVHVKSSPSAYTFKSTVRLKNVSGSGTSTVYAGGGKRQGGSNFSGWINEAKYYLPFYGPCQSSCDAFANGDILNGVGFFGTAVFEVFTLGIGTEISAGAKSVNVAAKTGVQVEQYALRAAEDGFYPVMKRGFANPQELTWLNKAEVWKFGTTKNPLTRYSQSYLDNIGEYGVYYSKEFSGTLQQSLQLERMKIMNFMEQYGFKPAGNKMIK